jgi:hypothetical protein
MEVFLYLLNILFIISCAQHEVYTKDLIELNEKDFVRDEYYYTGLTEQDSLIAIGLFIESDQVNAVKLKLIDVNGNPLTSTIFRELEFEDEYEVRYLQIIGGGLIPYLRIRTWSTNCKIGMWYIYYNGSIGRIDTLGYLPSEAGDTLTIAQLRPRDPDPNDPGWDLMMRNIYRFGTMEPISVDVTILKIITGGNDIEIDPASGKEYVELLGLDSDANGVIDSTQIIWNDACIIFPDKKPFMNPVLGADTVPSIYNKRFSALLPGEGENFRIVITSVHIKD